MALFGSSKSEEKVMKVDDIVVEDSIYPRKSPDWITSYKYSQAMRAKVNFPPIVVARIDGKFLLVDGFHRLQANKLNKIEHVSVTVLEGLTREQAFLESVRLNVAHGQPLNVADRTRVILRLRDMKYPIEKISEIVHIPVDKINSFVAQRVTTTTLGKPVVLRKSVEHLSHEEPISEAEEQVIEDSGFSSTRQSQIFGGAIKLLENPKFIEKDEKTLEMLKTLKKLINQYFKQV